MKTAKQAAGSVVAVCCFCGSFTPETLEPYCAHGQTAKVTGEARQAAARLWIAFQSMEAHRKAFGATLDEEVKAGRTTVNRAPPVRDPGENVSFLQDRAVHVSRVG